MGHSSLVDAVETYAEDPDWLHDYNDRQLRILKRAAKLAGVGITLYFCLYVFTFAARSDQTNNPELSMSLGQGEAFAAFGILIGFTSLLVPVSVSLSSRIKSEDDKELAYFLQPLANLATLPALISPTIALALVFSYGLNQIDLPSIVAAMSAVALTTIACAWVVEILYLGEKFYIARAHEESRALVRSRLRAALYASESRLPIRRKNLATRLIVLMGACILFGISTWAITFVSGKPSPGMALLSFITMLATLLATYFGQLFLRRGDVLDAFIVGLAWFAWVFNAALAMLAQASTLRISVSITVFILWIAFPILLMSRRAEKLRVISTLSLRPLIGCRLRKDAQRFLNPQGKKNNRRATERGRYRRLTGQR